MIYTDLRNKISPGVELLPGIHLIAGLSVEVKEDCPVVYYEVDGGREYKIIDFYLMKALESANVSIRNDFWAWTAFVAN